MFVEHIVEGYSFLFKKGWIKQYPAKRYGELLEIL
jgi:hypothetical protein